MSESEILWADTATPRRFGTEHFLTAGASGSGKTTLIQNLMRSVFLEPSRALVYDPKSEFAPLLFAACGDSEGAIIDGASNVKILHPFDERCCAWDIAKDIRDPVTARQFASILVPESEKSGNSESFFTQATQDLLTGVVLAFVNCSPKNDWTFRDVILALLHEPYLRLVLSQIVDRNDNPMPNLARLRRSYLEGDPRTVSNIRASINTRIAIYEPIAALWDAATRKNQGRKVSFSEWAADGNRWVLVLGNDEAARTSLDPINQAMFRRASECLLARPELPSEMTQEQAWVILDEVREAGELTGLGRLMTKGRSKGVCVVLGFQDINGLRDVYGEEVANEIVAQCNNAAIMRLNSPETAQWASELFGKRKLLAATRGINVGKDGAQIQSSSSESELPYLFSADFMYLPLPRAAKGVKGFLKTPDSEPEDLASLGFLVRNSLASEFFGPGVRVRDTGYHAQFLRAKAEDQYLRPWSQADLDRLGLACDLRRVFATQEEAAMMGAPDALTGAPALLEVLKVFRGRGKRIRGESE